MSALEQQLDDEGAEQLDDEAWRQQAACSGADPSVFFPSETTGPKSEPGYDRARAICSTCPVIEACLREHLDEQHGCFGGTSPMERRRLRRERDGGRGRRRRPRRVAPVETVVRSGA